MLTSNVLRSIKQVSTYFAMATGLGAAACSSPAPVAAEPPLAVRITEVRRTDLAEEVRYIGTVRSVREVTVLARVAGTLDALPVAEGASVRSGEVLARIETPDLAARTSQAASELERARSERDYLCATHETDLRLLEAGAVSQAQVDASGRACRAARSSVAAAGARRSEVGSVLDRRVERAPFAGRVLEHLAESGEAVVQGRPLLLLGDDVLEIEVEVNEHDLALGIQPGTPAVVRPRGEGALRSSVRDIAARAHGPSRTIAVRVDLPEGTSARHGTSAEVSLELARAERVTAVPVDAVTLEHDGTVVYVIEDGLARRQRVEVGIRDDGWIAVQPDLEPGATVAVSNLGALVDGARVYAVGDER
jgi:HlyD family secretion protein